MEAIITVGIPASGKSTFAKEKVKEGFIEINRDNIRDQLLKEKYPFEANLSKVYYWKQKWEKEVTVIEKQQLQQALDKKEKVIISNMNLHKGRRESLIKTLEEYGYTIQIVEFPIEFDVAVKRDKARPDGCGYDVLRLQYKAWLNYLKDKGVFTPYIPDTTKPEVLMFDIDGTVTNMNGRNPFDWNNVGKDTVDLIMKFLIESWVSSGKKVIFLSGRDGICYQATQEWIENNILGLNFGENAFLYMRGINDMRKDSVVKLELFNEHVAKNFNVKAVFDDRPQVVRMWHDIGLKVWATGDQLINF